MNSSACQERARRPAPTSFRCRKVTGGTGQPSIHADTTELIVQPGDRLPELRAEDVKAIGKRCELRPGFPGPSVLLCSCCHQPRAGGTVSPEDTMTSAAELLRLDSMVGAQRTPAGAS